MLEKNFPSTDVASNSSNSNDSFLRIHLLMASELRSSRNRKYNTKLKAQQLSFDLQDSSLILVRSTCRAHKLKLHIYLVIPSKSPGQFIYWIKYRWKLKGCWCRLFRFSALSPRSSLIRVMEKVAQDIPSSSCHKTHPNYHPQKECT